MLTKAVLLFIFSSSFALAWDKVTFTIVDRIQFVVPGDWPVIASKSAPEKALFGVPDSQQHRREKKVSTSDHPAEEKQLVDGWRCRSFSAMQKSTQYTDWDCYRVVADCGVFVRIARLHLPKNPTDYDKQMEAVLSDLLKSVVTSKKVQDALAP